MEDAEEVALVGVVVDLRALALGEDVLDVERMPAEALGEHRRASIASGASRWIQVRPAALSSAGGDGGAETATTVSRARVRRMRGRLGIGTERILDRSGITGMFGILAPFPASTSAATRAGSSARLAGSAGSAAGTSRSSASAPTAATRQTAAASGQSANGAARG